MAIGKESFTLSCGSGCAMKYNEMGKNILGAKVEIKYKVTQYIDEKVEMSILRLICLIQI